MVEVDVSQLVDTNQLVESGVQNYGKLPDVDESNFQDMTDDVANILVHIRDDHEADMPSQKFSGYMFLGLFLGFVVLAGMIGMMIIYFSRCQERRKSKTNQRVETRSIKSFRSKLECRPWSEWNDKTEAMTDESFMMKNVSVSESSTENSDSDEDEAPADLEGGCQLRTCCALCSETFENGQPVYRSNNPQCDHEFHQVCMDKWLNIQNTCPTCNQPYILQTV